MGGGEYCIYAMLDKYGLDKDNDLTLAKQAFTMDAFLDGSLDVASVTSYNEYIVLLESGLTEADLNVISAETEGVFMLEDCIITDTEWLAENRETAEKFLRASLKGWRDACADTKAAADIVWKFMDQSSSNLDHQYAMAQMYGSLCVPEGFDINKLGYIDPAAVARTVEIALAYGIIEKQPDVMYDASLWESIT
jgi:NitT/TauT family transport system substrate-binding protein